MNIKPVTSSEMYQAAASAETRDDARERRQPDTKRDRKPGNAFTATAPSGEMPTAEAADEALRESQTIDSETIVELLTSPTTVKLHVAKAFKRAAIQPTPTEISDEKKVNKTL